MNPLIFRIEKDSIISVVFLLKMYTLIPIMKKALDNLKLGDFPKEN